MRKLLESTSNEFGLETIGHLVPGSILQDGGWDPEQPTLRYLTCVTGSPGNLNYMLIMDISSGIDTTVIPEGGAVQSNLAEMMQEKKAEKS